VSDLAAMIADARLALAEGLFADTFTTERGTSGACGVKNASGDGTPITIHCAITADILPSDTVYINSRTYTVIDSHGTHGLSLAKHYTLQETARASVVTVGTALLLEDGITALLLEDNTTALLLE
jgi:hypothetical protein